MSTSSSQRPSPDLPDIAAAPFPPAGSLLTLGRDLVLVWGLDHEHTWPILLVEARDARAELLGTLALVQTDTDDGKIPVELLTEVIQATAAIATRLFPEQL